MWLGKVVLLFLVFFFDNRNCSGIPNSFLERFFNCYLAVGRYDSKQRPIMRLVKARICKYDRCIASAIIVNHVMYWRFLFWKVWFDAKTVDATTLLKLTISNPVSMLCHSLTAWEMKIPQMSFYMFCYP